MDDVVTLVPKSLTKRGSNFLFSGTSESCGSCQLRRVCVENVQEGRLYEVLSAKKRKVFACPEYGELMACEVKMADVSVNLPAESAIEGITLQYSPARCEEVTCPNYESCLPLGLMTGDTISLIRVKRGTVKCQIGLKLRVCDVRLEL